MKYILAILIAFAATSEANITLDGKGHVANAAIEMHIDINEVGVATGHYFYSKTKTPIILEGRLVDEKIVLDTIGNPEINERFVGDVIFFENEIARITGKWYGKHGGYGESVAGYDFKINGGANPLADHKVTCEEMEQVPALVFELDDLGSGHGSRNEVDYRCPKSLAQLDFLQKIIGQASGIRSPSPLPQFCTGSIIHAQWRYYHFDLARLGYYPQGYSSRGSKQKGMEYFEEWSYQSVHNRAVYNDYRAELENARPLLIEWYAKTHSVALDAAQQYADLALKRISDNGFGSYFYNWQPEALVSFTDQALTGAYNNFLASIDTASEVQKVNSLRRLLIHHPAEGIIERLVAAVQDTSLEKRSESPLSNAVFNSSNVQLLLASGYAVDHQNEFGKTALYYAIQFNQHDSARVLLDAGANVNHAYQLEQENKWSCVGIEQWGRTPLMHAAQHSDTKMLALLLEHGANMRAQDAKGASAADYAKNNLKPENERFLIQTLGESI